MRTINLRHRDFTTRFEKLIEELGKIQNGTIPGYKSLLDHFDLNQKIALRSFAARNHKTWLGLMSNRNMKPDAKAEELKKLNDTMTKASDDVCELIRVKQDRARQLADVFDTSKLIADITKLVQDAIDKENRAVREMQTIPYDVRNGIEKTNENVEGVLGGIHARMKYPK